ncbi:MAG: hypothetical protein Fur0018_20660 [Anaerolineales bacterium]
MFDKFFSRHKNIPQARSIEKSLAVALTPVTPRPAFVQDVKVRLLTAYRDTQPPAVSPLPGLWGAARRYGRALMALTGLRAWRTLLTAAVFMLGGSQRSAKRLQTKQVGGAA